MPGDLVRKTGAPELWVDEWALTHVKGKVSRGPKIKRNWEPTKNTVLQICLLSISFLFLINLNISFHNRIRLWDLCAM